METKNELTKKSILEIINSSKDMNLVLGKLGDLLGTLNPIEHADDIQLVCDASILCANKINRSEMIAQFYVMKAKAELSKPIFFIHEMRNLTMALGWFAHALKSEKQRYEELDKKVNEIWKNVQILLNTGFEYLKQNPYVGPTAYCYETAGEVYASFYLQLKLYDFGSSRPWKSKIANMWLIRLLNLDDLFLLNKASRKRIRSIKKDCLKYLRLAVEYFKKEKSWKFLANCYLTLAVEHHSFNNPVRSKLSIYKAKRIIKKHKIIGLNDRVKSANSMPLLGSNRD